MLSRILSGAILSVACVLAVQAAEQALDVAVAELDTALAAPTEAALEMPQSASRVDCEFEGYPPCLAPQLFAGELAPDIDSYTSCALPTDNDPAITGAA
jgi:hypothetical protein